MKAVLLAAVALLAILLDLTLFAGLRLWGGHPSAVTAVIATWSVLRRREEVMILAPLCGLGLGLLGNEPLGASLIALAVIAFLGWSRTPDRTEGRFLHAMGVAGSGALLYVAILTLVVGAADRVFPDLASLVRSMAGAAILTILLAAVLYLPLARTAWRHNVPGQFRRM